MPLLLTLLFLSAFSACTQESETQVEKNNNEHVRTRPSLTFLVHPYDNPSRLVARFSPLCAYLSKVTGQTVKLVIARSYVDQVQRITKGQADLAYMGPTPFLRAQDHYLAGNEKKLVPFAAEVKGGNASYQSVIVVRDTSNIQTINDIEDHSFAFGAPHSFSSHYVPRVMLGSSELAFKNLRDYAYLGRHERVALAVLHGDFDAGGLNRDVAKRYQDRKPGLRVISTSAPLPPHLIVARPDLPRNILEQLTVALVEPDTRDHDYILAMASLGKGTRFTSPEMQSFDYARSIIKAVESYPARLEPQ